MDTKQLARALTIAFQTFQSEQGVRNRLINYSMLQGIATGAAAVIPHIDADQILACVMQSRLANAREVDEAVLASKLDMLTV